MSTNRLMPFQRRIISMHSNCHSIRKFLDDNLSLSHLTLPTVADILGHEKIDLTRLKKQAQLTRTQIPKIPRIARTLSTLESVLKVLEDHSRAAKQHIDQLIESVEQDNPQLARVTPCPKRNLPLALLLFPPATTRISSGLPQTSSSHRLLAELERMLLPVCTDAGRRSHDVQRLPANSNETRVDRAGQTRLERMYSSQSSLFFFSFPQAICGNFCRLYARSKRNWNRCWARLC